MNQNYCVTFRLSLSCLEWILYLIGVDAMAYIREQYPYLKIFLFLV